MKRRIAGVIPSRWGSTRFPGKSLAPIGGKPLLAWVVERTRQAARLDEIHAMMLDTFYERHLDYLMLKESIAGHELDALMEKIEQFAGISKS